MDICIKDLVIVVVIKPFLNQKLIVKEYRGTNGSGGDVYSEEYVIDGRIEPKKARVRDSTGREVTATGRIFLDKDVRIPTGSIIKFMDTEFKVISLSPCFGFSENHVEGWLE